MHLSFTQNSGKKPNFFAIALGRNPSMRSIIVAWLVPSNGWERKGLE
jgi:hypothetical protein